MEKLKCDICGGSIMVQPGGQVAVCESCGVRYSIGRMREKVQEIRGVVSVEGTVQTQDADFIIRGGVLTRYNGNDVHVTIPDTVVEIGPKAFEKCAGIQSVNIPQSVTCIGAHAFSGCRSLADVELSNNLLEIKIGAFSECTALKRVCLPDTLVTIDAFVFSGCISLESINIPDSVSEKSSFFQTFINCPSLKEVQISDQQLKSLGFVSQDIFEKHEMDGDFSDYYIDKNCGPWYLNLKNISIETAKRKDDWKKRGLCQYCGAKFEGGFFSVKKCSNCGKPKDYSIYY